MLTRAREDSPDVLLIYDCCHPLSATPTNTRQNRAVVECIFAGGLESKVPVPGPESFTKALTTALARASSKGEVVSVVELHRQLICDLANFTSTALFDDEDEIRQDESERPIITSNSRATPSHIFLSKRDRTIRLIPTSAKKGKQPVRDTSNGKTVASQSSWPKTLLAVHLRDDSKNLEDLKSWLLEAPPGVVEFCGVHPSFSSLILVAVAVPVWDLLPDSHAVSFVGFATGPQVSLSTLEPNQNTTTLHVYDMKTPETSHQQVSK
jgi:hypothetical protein